MSAVPTLREWLREQPFTLGMSSGFFGFFAHTGMLTALEEADLLPARLVGASAGGLVAGCWGAGMGAHSLGEVLMELERSDFWDPKPGLGLLRGQRFRAMLRELLPVAGFDETRRPVAVSVFDMLTRTTRVRDHGELATALHATCAVPVLFQPVWIDRRPFLDGGVLDRPGLTAVPEGERLLFHHLPSRSPWRRKGSDSMKIPERGNMTALVLHNLPRSGPHRLGYGRLALELAYRATVSALDRPTHDARVELVL